MAAAMPTAVGARVLARGRTAPAFYNRMRGGGVDFLRTKASSRGRVMVWPGYGGVWAVTCGGRRANGVRRRRQPACEDGTRGIGLSDHDTVTASTVPCHSDQGTMHVPALEGDLGMPAYCGGRRAATASRTTSRSRALLFWFNFTWPCSTGFSSRIFNKSDPR
jgi:hypothetical protein